MVLKTVFPNARYIHRGVLNQTITKKNYSSGTPPKSDCPGKEEKPGEQASSGDGNKLQSTSIVKTPPFDPPPNKCGSVTSRYYDSPPSRTIGIHHHHQPINVPTAGAQAFPMDSIGRLGHDPPHGLSADWRVLTTADAAGTNSLTCLSKHGGTRDRRFSVTHPMIDHCECCLTSTIAAKCAIELLNNCKSVAIKRQSRWYLLDTAFARYAQLYRSSHSCAGARSVSSLLPSVVRGIQREVSITALLITSKVARSTGYRGSNIIKNAFQNCQDL
ncbi:hypothetical protein evm_014127 [Chilo suppressalis]|nr:hypothetical protein evm_014127 [Chilo suppressalis]